MNVAGFEEAWASAVSLEIERSLTVRVAALPGLTLLKLLAWVDRGRVTNKDATDLYRLFTAYADAGNLDRIYDCELDLLEAAGFDLELAGAELLGHDVAGIYSPIARDQVRSMLQSSGDFERLVDQIQTSRYLAGPVCGIGHRPIPQGILRNELAALLKQPQHARV